MYDVCKLHMEKSRRRVKKKNHQLPHLLLLTSLLKIWLELSAGIGVVVGVGVSVLSYLCMSFSQKSEVEYEFLFHDNMQRTYKLIFYLSFSQKSGGVIVS